MGRVVYSECMRTTIEIDDDLVQVAKQLAAQRRTTMGQVVSILIRKALTPEQAPQLKNGIPVFQPVAKGKTAKVPSLDLINELRDEP